MKAVLLAATLALACFGCGGNNSEPHSAAGTAALEQEPWVGHPTGDASTVIDDMITTVFGRHPSGDCVDSVLNDAPTETVEWVLWASATGSSAMLNNAPAGAESVLSELLNC